jgi:ribosome-associated protein
VKKTTRKTTRKHAVVSRSQTLAKLCRDIALDKKAEDPLILDVSAVSSVADCFVICTGTSEPHLKAIATEVEQRLRERGYRMRRQDGYPASRWLVLDYGSVLVHIFHPEMRQRYALEQLWGDGRRVK